MTRLFNDPSRFAAEALDGFVAANRDLVLRVPGGVIRNAPKEAGTVAVVVGGGSGHYPAFAGLVGRGLAHGAVIGNVFASPSATQVCSVARAASSGGGVLLSYGNYAGDVLNFTAALTQLRAEGIDCRAVIVTDDISSAPPGEAAKRRGVAGDLVVFKIASTAADQGRPLAEVARLAELANHRTRSFGVALAGCTLPGADAPLFTIPPGRMAVGLGVHGEPGVGEQDRPSADELAELLVTTLLSELPPGVAAPVGQRATVLLNGLGSIKYEELFVVYRHVDELLAAAGLEIVAPAVGELVTSFDMAGVSLTICWLTDELAELWCTPVDAPGFRRGAVAPSTTPTTTAGVPEETRAPVAAPPERTPAGSPASRAAARLVLAGLTAARRVVDDAADELGRIDAVAGDGDHGIGMSRGVNGAVVAATAALAAGAGAGTLLVRAADAWADNGGGTSGALWGVALRGAGAVIGDDEMPTADGVRAAVAAGLTDLMRVGGASLGDKTMLDTLAPFADALTEAVRSGRPLPDAWRHAAAVARSAAEATAGLVPKVGRARPLAERSLGTADPGAVSLALILTAVGDLVRPDQRS